LDYPNIPPDIKKQTKKKKITGIEFEKRTYILVKTFEYYPITSPGGWRCNKQSQELV
jgi:hypothetical protein